MVVKLCSQTGSIIPGSLNKLCLQSRKEPGMSIGTVRVYQGSEPRRQLHRHVVV